MVSSYSYSFVLYYYAICRLKLLFIMLRKLYGLLLLCLSFEVSYITQCCVRKQKQAMYKSAKYIKA